MNQKKTFFIALFLGLVIGVGGTMAGMALDTDGDLFGGRVGKGGKKTQDTNTEITNPFTVCNHPDPYTSEEVVVDGDDVYAVGYYIGRGGYYGDCIDEVISLTPSDNPYDFGPLVINDPSYYQFNYLYPTVEKQSLDITSIGSTESIVEMMFMEEDQEVTFDAIGANGDVHFEIFNNYSPHVLRAEDNGTLTYTVRQSGNAHKLYVRITSGTGEPITLDRVDYWLTETATDQFDDDDERPSSSVMTDPTSSPQTHVVRTLTPTDLRDHNGVNLEEGKNYLFEFVNTIGSQNVAVQRPLEFGGANEQYVWGWEPNNLPTDSPQKLYVTASHTGLYHILVSNCRSFGVEYCEYGIQYSEIPEIPAEVTGETTTTECKGRNKKNC